LGEGGGGDADEADAAMKEGRGQACGIEECAAADGDAVGMATNGAGLKGV